MPDITAERLTDTEKIVLRAVLERKLVRGGELLKYASFDKPADLVEPIRNLLKLRLLDASGLSAEPDADSIMFATFSSRPSLNKWLRELADW